MDGGCVKIGGGDAGRRLLLGLWADVCVVARVFEFGNQLRLRGRACH